MRRPASGEWASGGARGEGGRGAGVAGVSCMAGTGGHARARGGRAGGGLMRCPGSAVERWWGGRAAVSPPSGRCPAVRVVAVEQGSGGRCWWSCDMVGARRIPRAVLSGGQQRLGRQRAISKGRVGWAGVGPAGGGMR